MTTQPTHKGEVYTFHITPSTPEAHERIADGAEKPELLRGTLAQGRDLARLLNSPIDLLFGTGHTAFHINPDGRMPCEIDPNEADIQAHQAQIREAMESLASGPASIVGLVVDYRGWSVQLLAVNVEEDDAYGPYKWQATAISDLVDDECVGRGMTPMEALDRCADEADAESFDDEDCDDGEPDEEDGL